MSQYKLTYFNMPGRGQIARTIFAIADVKYEEIRINFNEWKEKQKGAFFVHIQKRIQ